MIWKRDEYGGWKASDMNWSIHQEDGIYYLSHGEDCCESWGRYASLAEAKRAAGAAGAILTKGRQDAWDAAHGHSTLRPRMMTGEELAGLVQLP